MTKLKKMIDHVKEELCDAKEYAEMYIEYRSWDDMKNANRYKEMANDELNHAMYLHEMLADEIKRLEKVFQAPESMIDEWEKSHAEYVEQTAYVKMMLSL